MRLVVWRLAPAVTEQEVRQLFEPYGIVERVQIFQNHEKRNAHSLVDMPSHMAGIAALREVHGIGAGGQPFLVQRDTTQERTAAMRSVDQLHREMQRQALVTALKKRHAALATLQAQLTTPKKPRWGSKRVTDLVALLKVPSETLAVLWWEQEPFAVTQARVTTELAQVEAELARLHA